VSHPRTSRLDEPDLKDGKTYINSETFRVSRLRVSRFVVGKVDKYTLERETTGIPCNDYGCEELFQ
jgi:hypothetical protein